MPRMPFPTIHRRLLIPLMFLMGVLLAESVSAQIVTDRPTQSVGATTVSGGVLQLEAGIGRAQSGEGELERTQFTLPTNLLRYGINDRIELRFVSQYEVVEVGGFFQNGPGDFQLGTKIELLNGEEINTQIAVMTKLIIPSGQDGISSDKYGSTSRLSFGHRLSEKLSMTYNLGYDYFGAGNGNLAYTLMVDIGLGDKLSAYLESYGGMVELEEFVVNANGGFLYKSSDRLQFDLSGGAGINEPMYFLAVGCSWIIRERKA